MRLTDEIPGEEAGKRYSNLGPGSQANCSLSADKMKGKCQTHFKAIEELNNGL